MFIETEIVDALNRSNRFNSLDSRPQHLRMRQVFERGNLSGDFLTSTLAPILDLGHDRLQTGARRHSATPLILADVVAVPERALPHPDGKPSIPKQRTNRDAIEPGGGSFSVAQNSSEFGQLALLGWMIRADQS